MLVRRWERNHGKGTLESHDFTTSWLITPPGFKMHKKLVTFKFLSPLMNYNPGLVSVLLASQYSALYIVGTMGSKCIF